jgi:cell division protease FtsH
MGGRVAEEIIFGNDKVTSGASSDIEMATKMARNMVTKYGMSEKLGPLQYSENEEEVFLGRSVQKHQNVSEDTARLIDSEIRIIVDKCYDLARKILTEKINDLHALAKGLIEYETLNGDEILSLLKDGKIDRPNPEEEINNAGPSVPKSGKPSTVVPGFKPKPQTS